MRHIPNNPVTPLPRPAKRFHLSTWLPVILLPALIAILAGCSASSDGETAASSSDPLQVAPSEWRLLPQFPPREQVISRRLLGLNDLFMLDSNTAWVVGTDGAIGRTTDGGDSFALQKSGTAINLTAVSFVDSDSGWVVGTAGTVLKTADGGDSWEILQAVPGVFALESVHFQDSMNGWTVADSGGIYKTADGGATWTKLDSGTREDLLDISFLSDNSRAWAVGYDGAVVHSADGGQTWSAQNSGTESVLYSVWFASPDFGVAVGESGTVIRTTDGGATWQPLDSGQDQDLFGVFFLDESNGWAVGARNLVIRSTDGGATWTMEETTTSKMATASRGSCSPTSTTASPPAAADASGNSAPNSSVTNPRSPLTPFPQFIPANAGNQPPPAFALTPALPPVIPALPPVIPANAGIHHAVLAHPSFLRTQESTTPSLHICAYLATIPPITPNPRIPAPRLMTENSQPIN